VGPDRQSGPVCLRESKMSGGDRGNFAAAMGERLGACHDRSSANRQLCFFNL
jgi:hypothetical protein